MSSGQRELFSSIDFRRFTPELEDTQTPTPNEVSANVASGQMVGPVVMNGADIEQPLSDA